MLQASIIVIGDEILGGFVQDTNSHWLARRLQDHAVPLTRIQTVPDEFADIDEALRTELGRARPRLVITTGGIGSTPDDLTYEAVAQSLGLPLVEEQTMVGRIDRALEWTAQQGIDVTDEFAWHMKRMARIPEGAHLIEHPGWAPGLRLDLDGGVDDPAGATLIVLPGVPSQVREIVATAIEPTLLAGRNAPQRVLELTHGFPESALNLCFARILDEHPEVKVGSYPGVPMTVRLTGPPGVVDDAFAVLREYVRELEVAPAGVRLAAAWADRMGGTDRDRR